MPRKGNCWDITPMESFFRHFNVLAGYKSLENLGDIRKEVDRVIKEYNQNRYQSCINKMAPELYREHLL
ncbi:IS3 family transposase [Bacillus infantis]|uniref:IS3 family transposase n=1 Tax=Bacillus infantis TaxID=324767 RepID=UPI0039EA0726